MGAENGQKSLSERIEMPEIPMEVAREFALLEQRFIRAETDRCKLPLPFVSPWDDTHPPHLSS
jgi:hypothetical protein